ncbi:hypothetical protein DXG03_007151 [Asterophora parasitica]|uniref:Mannosyltransferase n=1 Tax=Asterophora parasitica TaxID=117018 RepID=A0A9P7KEP3_9AGAR|nr:hypothetical protein DXG03_007151 [Asterophora parasitica]
MTATRVALVVRVLIALCTRTVFQPDEYFQSLEPAHKAVFGYAQLTWEWLAPKPIRSIFYPALNIPIYWTLKASGLSEMPGIGSWLLVCAWNTNDTRVTLKRGRSTALGCCTAFLPQVRISGSAKSPVNGLVVNTCRQRIIATLALFSLDSLYYGRPTFTPWNFLMTNLSSVSLFYGSSPWHYYLVQALPILCTTALPFVLHGAWSVIFDRHAAALRNMLATIVWTIGIYSVAGHKEWRFIHPILPLLYILAAKSLVDLSDRRQEKTKLAANSSTHLLMRTLPPIRQAFLVFLSLTIPASLYVVLFYCSAPISVLSYIRSLPADDLHVGGIGFLMPCHSTPGHAYIHRKELVHGKMWSLGCEPPLQNQNLSTYRDQTDVFFRAPVEYLESRFPPRVDPSFPLSPYPASVPGAPTPEKHPWIHEWPRYLVFFGALLEHEGVQNLLEAKDYAEVWRKGRAWEGEGERKGGVRVWRWKGFF